MDILLLIVILLVAVGGFAAVFFAVKKGQQPERQDDKSLMMLQNQINEMARVMDTKLGESTRVLQQQFGHSTQMIKDITQELTKVTEGHKQVMTVTDQLKSLQDILKNPKQRGVLGEYYLETVLKNVLPPGSYQMQYPFKDGSIVDAVVFIKDHIIPVDSKFSLENYNRILASQDPAERDQLELAFRTDLKNRIDETSKYVKQDENTMDFAFMFIPSEGVYYDLLINQVGAVKVNARNLIEYAFVDKKVIIVSPTSFLAYLQTVMQGMKALQIEESAKIIRKRVEELGRHLNSYDAYMKKMGGHLTTTVSMYNNAYKEFGKIDKDVMRITGERVGIEPESIAAPVIEES